MAAQHFIRTTHARAKGGTAVQQPLVAAYHVELVEVEPDHEEVDHPDTQHDGQHDHAGACKDRFSIVRTLFGGGGVV